MECEQRPILQKYSVFPEQDIINKNSRGGYSFFSRKLRQKGFPRDQSIEYGRAGENEN